MPCLKCPVRPWESSHTVSPWGIPFAGNRRWFEILNPNLASSFELRRLITILEALTWWQTFLIGNSAAGSKAEFWSWRMRRCSTKKREAWPKGSFIWSSSPPPPTTPDCTWLILRIWKEIPHGPQTTCFYLETLAVEEFSSVSSLSGSSWMRNVFPWPEFCQHFTHENVSIYILSLFFSSRSEIPKRSKCDPHSVAVSTAPTSPCCIFTYWHSTQPWEGAWLLGSRKLHRQG